MCTIGLRGGGGGEGGGEGGRGVGLGLGGCCEMVDSSYVYSIQIHYPHCIQVMT